MPAPDLTQRESCFVQKQGTDDPGANAVGAPFSRLTIAYALFDLATNYPVASATNPHIVAVGPGTFDTPAFQLPPWTYINGACDGEGNPTTILRMSGDITLSSAWSANTAQTGGIYNVTIRALEGTPAIDFTMPVPVAGNPVRRIELERVTHNLRNEIFEATGTGDIYKNINVIQDGSVATDTLVITGGTSLMSGRLSAAAITIKDKTSFAAAGTWHGVSTGTGSGITVSSVAAAGCSLRLLESSARALVINQTAPGAVLVTADSCSLPIRSAVSFTGTATLAANLVYFNDAAGEGYTPTTAGDWAAPVPTNVQQALDRLAPAGGTGVASNADAVLGTNTTGDTTVTATAHNYFATWIIGGAARTTNLVAALPTAAANGDILQVLITLPATTTIVLNIRNATAGGTLLDTFTTDGVILSWLLTLEYHAGAWVLWASQKAQTQSQIMVTQAAAGGVGIGGTFSNLNGLKVFGTTASTTTTTGALQVVGGVGIQGAVFAGGSLNGNQLNIAAGSNNVGTVSSSSAAGPTLNFSSSNAAGTTFTWAQGGFINALTVTFGLVTFSTNVVIGLGLSLSKTITPAGTTGAQVINNATGQVNFAAGASTLVVTNNLATVNSIIIVQVLGTDTTAISARVTKAAGSFTITLVAPATAETAVEFRLTN